jgi:hypothetical protein
MDCPCQTRGVYCTWVVRTFAIRTVAYSRPFRPRPHLPHNLSYSVSSVAYEGFPWAPPIVVESTGSVLMMTHQEYVGPPHRFAHRHGRHNGQPSWTVRKLCNRTFVHMVVPGGESAGWMTCPGGDHSGERSRTLASKK